MCKPPEVDEQCMPPPSEIPALTGRGPGPFIVRRKPLRALLRNSTIPNPVCDCPPHLTPVPLVVHWTSLGTPQARIALPHMPVWGSKSCQIKSKFVNQNDLLSILNSCCSFASLALGCAARPWRSGGRLSCVVNRIGACRRRGDRPPRRAIPGTARRLFGIAPRLRRAAFVDTPPRTNENGQRRASSAAGILRTCPAARIPCRLLQRLGDCAAFLSS